MKPRVLTGSKHEIAEQVAEIEGDIREAIVFIDEPAPAESAGDVFAEMGPATVQQPEADDSRQAIYRRMQDE